MKEDELRLFAAVGPRLTHWAVQADGSSMRALDTFTLPANVQYAWPHPCADVLYVASSNGGTRAGPPGDCHHLSACVVDPRSGKLTALGEPIVLPSRPIHVTVDPSGTYALLAFNRPGAIRVYAINSDGSAGPEVMQVEPIDAGNYPHQARVTADGKTVLTVALGTNPSATQAEEPGAINVFAFAQGQLRAQKIVAPQGGINFGPRHLDIHPNGRWVYVSLERQNRMEMFKFDGRTLADAPLSSLPLLSRPQPPAAEQHGGTVHVHPSGRFVYGVNRAWQAVDVKGTPVLAAGENTLAVFGIDPDSGALTLIEHVDTQGIHCRTFHISPDGRTLVAAHIMGLNVRDGQNIRPVPAGLAIFGIAQDGRLHFKNFLALEMNGASLFWMGMPDFQQRSAGNKSG